MDLWRIVTGNALSRTATVSSTPPATVLCRFEDSWLDMTDFRHVHPGGRLWFDLCAGQDITPMVHTLHADVATQRKLIAGLPHVTDAAEIKRLNESIAHLPKFDMRRYEQVKKRLPPALLRPRKTPWTLHDDPDAPLLRKVLDPISVLPIAMALLHVVMWLAGPERLGVQLVLCTLMGMVTAMAAGIGHLMHHCGPRFWMQYTFEWFGMSNDNWWRIHCVGHHYNTNHSGLDLNDHQTPFVWHEEHTPDMPAWRRLVALAVFVVSTFLSGPLSAIAYVVVGPHLVPMCFQLGRMLVTYALLRSVPMAIGFVLLQYSVAYLHFITIAMITHNPVAKPPTDDWLQDQDNQTLDIDDFWTRTFGMWGSMLYLLLDHQRVHHFFPGVPPCHWLEIERRLPELFGPETKGTFVPMVWQMLSGVYFSSTRPTQGPRQPPAVQRAKAE